MYLDSGLVILKYSTCVPGALLPNQGRYEEEAPLLFDSVRRSNRLNCEPCSVLAPTLWAGMDLCTSEER